MLGGDEEQCSDLYNRIQYQFARQQEYGGRKFFCTVSAGLAFYPKDGDNYLELLKYANYSLEHSKVLGKNRSTVFSRSILWEKERRLKMAELFSCFRRNLRTCTFVFTSKKTRRPLRKNLTAI